VKVQLPKPPSGSSQFIYNLVATLRQVFSKVRPASGWKDKEAPLASAKVAGSKPPTWTVFRDGIYAYEFDASTENEAWITFHLPHDLMMSYTEPDGTVTSPKLFPHVHYSSNAATPSTGVVRWGFEWTYANGYSIDDFSATSTVYIEHTPSGTQYYHEIAEVSDDNALTGDFETDGLILFRFFRDAGHANDTNADDLHVFTIDLHYLSDGLETVERNRGSGTVPWHKQNPL